MGPVVSEAPSSLKPWAETPSFACSARWSFHYQGQQQKVLGMIQQEGWMDCGHLRDCWPISGPWRLRRKRMAGRSIQYPWSCQRSCSKAGEKGTMEKAHQLLSDASGRLLSHRRGYYVPPTVLSNLPGPERGCRSDGTAGARCRHRQCLRAESSAAWKQEIFGPVLAIRRETYAGWGYGGIMEERTELTFALVNSPIFFERVEFEHSSHAWASDFEPPF